MKISEFFAEIGFKFDSLKLKEVVKTIGDLNLSSVVGAASFAKLGDTIGKVMEKTSDTASSLRSLSMSTGLSQDFIYRFEQMSKMMTVSKEKADSFLSSLSNLRREIALGHGDQRSFAMMGINPLATDEVDILDKVNKFLNNPKALKGWGITQGLGGANEDQLRAALISDIFKGIGGAADLMPVMKDFDKLNKEVISSPNATTLQRSLEVTKQWAQVTNDLNVASMNAVSKLTEALTHILQLVNKSKAIPNIIGGLANFIDPGKTENAWKVHPLFPNLQKQVLDLLTPGSYRVDPKWLSGGNKVEINNAITVHAQDATDFATIFETLIKRKLQDAEMHFGQIKK